MRMFENRVLRRIFGSKRLQRSGENYIMRNFTCAGDIIENEMGGESSACGEGRGMYRVLVEKPEGKSHWGDPGVDGRIILRCTMWGMGWIELAQDRDRWRELVNAVMNLRVP
jgi:hypothetical protein